MTNVNVAIIEVLTAEVRVLMVGSRQVTLSVFRQLDIKPYDEVAPMGRVNDKDGGKWIVGSDDQGNLVRAEFFWEYPTWTRDDEKELSETKRQVETIPRGDVASEAYLLEKRNKFDRLLEEKRNIPIWQQEVKEALALFKALPLVIMAGLR